MEGQFPRRTACEVTLPDGTIIWMQTLNSFQRTEADRESNFAAALAMERFMPGGVLYRHYKLDFERMPENTLFDFLADNAILTGQVHMDAARKYPIPSQPERRIDDNDKLETEMSYTQRCLEYQTKVSEIVDERQAFVDAARERAFTKAKAMGKAERVKAALDATVQTEFASIYARRNQIEILWRACRQRENHLEFYYATTRHLEDVDDTTMNALVMKYNELDSLRIEEIPT